MEHVPCNLCKNDDAEFMFTALDLNQGQSGIFNLVRCRHCALVYLDPRPDKDEMLQWYPEAYFIGTNSNSGRTWPHPRFSDPRLARIMRFRRMTGSVLDIGCNNGDFLAEMRAGGWQTYGVEISPLAAARARAHAGLEVTVADFADTYFPSEVFDLVTMWHSLEHMRAPLEVLRSVHRILKANGLLALSTPNLASYQARIFREKWFHLDAPRHLYHFTPATLQRLLDQAGFETLTVSHFGGCHNYAGLRLSLIRTFFPQADGNASGAQTSGRHRIYPFIPIFNGICRTLVLLESLLRKGGAIEVYARKTNREND